MAAERRVRRRGFGAGSASATGSTATSSAAFVVDLVAAFLRRVAFLRFGGGEDGLHHQCRMMSPLPVRGCPVFPGDPDPHVPVKSVPAENSLTRSHAHEVQQGYRQRTLNAVDVALVSVQVLHRRLVRQPLRRQLLLLAWPPPFYAASLSSVSAVASRPTRQR